MSRNKNGIPVSNDPRPRPLTKPLLHSKGRIPIFNDPRPRPEAKPLFCNKDLYKTELDAILVAKMRPIKLKTYFCSRCDAWHLTKVR